jgi:hypothetical protein
MEIPFFRKWIHQFQNLNVLRWVQWQVRFFGSSKLDHWFRILLEPESNCATSFLLECQVELEYCWSQQPEPQYCCNPSLLESGLELGVIRQC